MQPSLVQRLRDSVTQCRALDRSQLLTEAADEVERLRNGGCDTVRLTDSERDAVEEAILFMETRGVWAWPETLRGLLERLK